jgi:hypothetical protein
MSDNSNKTKKRLPANNLGREDSAGQNPFWPGEGNQEAGEIVEGDETTTIPVVDSKPHPDGSET